ncbi:MAG: type II secretion system protein J [Acidobacteriota bacterium]
MKHDRAQERGVTLLEMAVSLAVLGILAVGSLSILPNVMQGALLARNAAASAENIQAALTRITHEVANIDTKRAYNFTSTAITYYYRAEASQNTIQLTGTTITLNGNVLLNNVVSGSGFQVTAPNYIASPAIPVGIRIQARVPTLDGTVTKSFTTKIELNTQRFQ